MKHTHLLKMSAFLIKRVFLYSKNTIEGALDVVAKYHFTGTCLEVLYLRFYTSNAGGTESIPGQGTKVLAAMWP